jgi:hypothetical protein
MIAYLRLYSCFRFHVASIRLPSPLFFRVLVLFLLSYLSLLQTLFLPLKQTASAARSNVSPRGGIGCSSYIQLHLATVSQHRPGTAVPHASPVRSACASISHVVSSSEKAAAEQ